MSKLYKKILKEEKKRAKEEKKAYKRYLKFRRYETMYPEFSNNDFLRYQYALDNDTVDSLRSYVNILKEKYQIRISTLYTLPVIDPELNAMESRLIVEEIGDSRIIRVDKSNTEGVTYIDLDPRTVSKKHLRALRDELDILLMRTTRREFATNQGCESTSKFQYPYQFKGYGIGSTYAKSETDREIKQDKEIKELHSKVDKLTEAVNKLVAQEGKEK